MAGRYTRPRRWLPSQHRHGALTQLTWGGPQVLYNGGPGQARLRYVDTGRRRAGLPPDIAALVTAIAPERTNVSLVNTGATETRTVIVQAGAFAEHRIETAACDSITRAVRGPYVTVTLQSATGTDLELTLTLRGFRPQYTDPWEEQTAR